MADRYERYDRWTWTLGRWWDDYAPLIVCGVLIAGLVGLTVWITAGANAERRAACASIMADARTARDSLDVRLRCELPPEDRTTVVPMPVYVPTR